MREIVKADKSMAENRKSERMERRESVSIQIISSSQHKQHPPEVASTETLDISAGGIKLYLNGSVREKTILDFCLEYSGETRRFLLTGEVRWCQAVEDSLFHVGIKILDAQGTDFVEWQELFDRELSDV